MFRANYQPTIILSYNLPILFSNSSEVTCSQLLLAFASFTEVAGVIYPMSISEQLSAHCDHILDLALSESRKKFRVAGRNVISDILTRATMTHMRTNGPPSQSPMVAPIRGSEYLNTPYPIPPQIIMIMSWRSDSHATMTSSFSIWIGILYCIAR